MAETARLESVWSRKVLVGSNPTPSVKTAYLYNGMRVLQGASNLKCVTSNLKTFWKALRFEVSGLRFEVKFLKRRERVGV